MFHSSVAVGLAVMSWATTSSDDVCILCRYSGHEDHASEKKRLFCIYGAAAVHDCHGMNHVCVQRSPRDQLTHVHDFDRIYPHITELAQCEANTAVTVTISLSRKVHCASIWSQKVSLSEPEIRGCSLQSSYIVWSQDHSQDHSLDHPIPVFVFRVMPDFQLCWRWLSVKWIFIRQTAA